MEQTNPVETSPVEKPPRRWRWGINRWWILLFIVLTVIGTSLIAPVMPHIQVAPESLLEKPLVTLSVIGEIPFTNTLLAMFIVDIILIALAYSVYRNSKKGSLVPTGISGFFEMLVEMLYNLTENTAGRWAKRIFPWFATILILVLFTNLIKMIPGFESIGLLHPSEEGYPISQVFGNVYTVKDGEAAPGEGYIVTPFLRGTSTDLNFTVALALISVIMTQVIGIRAQGPRYFSKFLNFTTMFKKPFLGFMDFIVGLLELISEFAKILSFSFRLFGVMFSGIVLVAIVSKMVPVFVPSLIYFFELFMGVIQAFVFGMLTMVFMAQATQGHGAEEHK